jgi:hypothetical protein
MRNGVGLFVMICAAGWAQKGDAPGIFAEDLRAGSTVEYDQMQWKVIKQTKATFDASLGPDTVVLLQSAEPTSTGGTNQPLNSVELLILRGETVVYDYVKKGVKPPDYNGTWFYMDDHLEISDVTNDHAPEILFHSGYVAVSDAATHEHIVSYNKTKKAFSDVAPDSFFDSGTHGLRWLTQRAQNLVVIADRNWSPGVPPDHRCHQCASPFQYDAYRWSSKTESFVEISPFIRQGILRDCGRGANRRLGVHSVCVNPLNVHFSDPPIFQALLPLAGISSIPH